MPLEKNRTRHIRALAKINLCLDIVGRRADHYHLLDTVMQSIDLADEMYFTWRDASGFTHTPSDLHHAANTSHFGSMSGETRILQRFDNFDLFGLELDLEQSLAEKIANKKSNILYKTLKQWLAALSPEMRADIRYCFNISGLVSPYLQVRLDKKIPYEAGLGGASADAACLLDFLDDSFSFTWPEDKRPLLESSIGADVPFTRHKGTARCLGIGEKIYPLPSLPPYPCVIIKPLRLGVKTAAAFKRYHEIFSVDPDSLQRPQSEAFAEAIKRREISQLQALSGNVFSSLIDEEFTALPQWIKRLISYGSFLASLSGSGTACFALFEREEEAAACVADLSRQMELDGLPFDLHLTKLVTKTRNN